jgi:Ca2+-binding RTX toxin-like protein
MKRGTQFRMPGHGRLLVGALALAAALALPAAASAETTVVEVSGNTLKISGLPGVSSKVEVLYKTASEAGFGGVGDRFVISDVGGVQAINPDCVGMEPTKVSCDARLVHRIQASLGDGDDVMVINASKGDGVPRRFRTDLHGQTGADVIRGGLANDRIYGEQGRDVVAGWSGNDFLSGGPGADGVIGFAGNDTLFGGAGRDALFGQKGHDRMFGGSENDVLLARDGTRDPKLNCGAGSRQRAVTDRHDPPSSNCRSPKS